MDMSSQQHKIWFTSDFHFGHDKEFLYGPRGFINYLDHDKAIISNWNSLIDEDDEVFILGDLMLRDNHYGIQCFNQLKGIKYIIFGNHDTDNRKEFYPMLRGVISTNYADMIHHGKYTFFLCHYPTMMDNLDRGRKIFNLHGHTHSPDKFQFIEHCCYNVALDAHDMKPVEINEIIANIQKYRQEHNNERQKA